MARTLKNLITAFAAFLLFTIFFPLIGGGAGYASAASSYSSVLEDLQKDSNFNVAEYPAGGKD